MSRQELYFTAFGDPAPQGSKQIGRNGHMFEASKKLKPWREAVADAVFRAFIATGDDSQFTEPIVVTATFFLPRKPSVKRLVPSVAPDLDKLCRGLGDALSINAKVIADDALIVKWHASKVYADDHDAGVRVAIKTLTLFEQTFDSNTLITYPPELI